MFVTTSVVLVLVYVGFEQYCPDVLLDLQVVGAE